MTKSALKDIKKHFPEYDAGQGYEIAGLFWHQGWNDHVNKQFTKDYPKNMAFFIEDLRRDLGTDFPVVIATTGMPTKRDAKQGKNSYKPIEKSQLALANKTLFPQFVGNVAVVDTKKYWKDISESPVPNGNQHYHWNEGCRDLPGNRFRGCQSLSNFEQRKVEWNGSPFCKRRKSARLVFED